MGGKTIRNSANKLDGLQLQSSVRGGTVPWVRGVTRIPGNLGWYDGFEAVPHTETQGGKGGGGQVENTTFSYRADMLTLLCRGPIIDTPRVFIGKKIYSGGVTPGQVATQVQTWTVPASGAMTVSLTYASTLLCVLEVTRPGGASGEQTLAEGQHWSISSAGVLTCLDTALRGVTLTITYQRSSSTIARTALADLGLSFFAGNIGQAMWSGLSAYSAAQVHYSGFAYLAGQDYPLGDSASLENHLFEVVGPGAYHLGSTLPDVDPAWFVREILIDQRDGAGFPGDYLASLSGWSDYCVASGLLVSPALTEQTTAADLLKTAAELTNSVISTSSGRVSIVPRADAAVTGNGRTWSPNITPVYDLTDDCWTPARVSDSPVRYRHRPDSQRYNTWTTEFRNRANNYALEPVDDQDAADIAARGVRANPSTVQAHWVCDGGVARQVTRLLMQRSVSVLTDYELPLPPHFSLIDLADPLTITDAALRLDRWPVMVTGIDEDAQGNLTVHVEDYPIGAASAPALTSPTGLGYLPDYNVAPGNVDTPAVVELPAQLAGATGLEVAIAARGLSANWGGCQVWTSLDGSNYRQVGTIIGPSRYGVLASALSAGASTLQVSGLDAGQLLSGSATDASTLQTLCFLGGSTGEYVAYQTATLTAPGAYTLTGVQRAAYGTPDAAHASGSRFVRLDERVARSGPLDSSLIGKTLYIKCLSFNIYGVAVQSLADVSAITYTVTGGARPKLPNVTGLDLVLKPGAMVASWDKPADPAPYYVATELRLSDTGWGTTPALYRGTVTEHAILWATPGATTIYARHIDEFGQSSPTTASFTLTVDDAMLIDTGNLLAGAVTDGSMTVGSSFTGTTAGSSVTVGNHFLGPIATVDDDQLDISIGVEQRHSLYFDVALFRVEAQVQRSNGISGTKVDVGKLVRFTQAPEVSANTTHVAADLFVIDAPGADTDWYYWIDFRVTSLTSSGSTVAAQGDYEGEAEWRIVRRKR